MGKMRRKKKSLEKYRYILLLEKAFKIFRKSGTATE